METNRLRPVIPPLLEWYGKNRRILPWREDPTPYRVWVSEIMLQQTRVSAAIEYYNRFLTAFPTVADLAYAPEEKLLKLWQGLGYYNRARNLQKGAQEVCQDYDGYLPASYDELRRITGIGDYTAGAIGSIAFGLKTPAVDGNVLRVVSRITGDTRVLGDPKLRAEYADHLRPLMPDGKESAFTQSLMELGALICVPNGKPHCETCPAYRFCVASQKGLTDKIPNKDQKKARRVEEREVYLLFSGDRVAIRKRKDRGLLAGLYEFPNELCGKRPEALSNFHAEPGKAAKHVFTHVEWNMRAYQFELSDPERSALPEEFLWVNASEILKHYPIPSAFGAFLPGVIKRLSNSD